MDSRLPSLIVAAAATDVALVAQDTGTGLISGLIACAALVVAFGKAPSAMLAVGLATVVLLQVGVVSASAVPGAAQVTKGWVAAEHWKDHQIEVASCRNRQISALSAGDAAALEAVERECA